MVIFNFRGGSTFYFRPILHSFPSELRSLQRTKTILRDKVPFYQEKEAVFEVILSTCSEFSQIGTPHFSLEGVGYDRSLTYKQTRKDLGLCDFSFVRYSKTYLTQIYTALYRDVRSVAISRAPHGGHKITETFVMKILLLKQKNHFSGVPTH